MSTVSLDKEKHIYKIDGEPVKLSVTRILEMAGLCGNYPPEAMGYVEWAGDLGDAVHEWCAYIDRTSNHDIDGLEGSEITPYVLAYTNFINKYQPNWQFIEIPFELEGIPGTPDRIGTIGGEIVIVDIKTARKYQPWWGIQLTAYKDITKLVNAKLYSLHLLETAEYALIQHDTDYATWDAAREISFWKLCNK